MSNPNPTWPFAHVIAEAIAQPPTGANRAAAQEPPQEPTQEAVSAENSEAAKSSNEATMETLEEAILSRLGELGQRSALAELPRRDLARQISIIASEEIKVASCELDLLEQRNLVGRVVNRLLEEPLSEPTSPDLLEAKDPQQPLRRLTAGRTGATASRPRGIEEARKIVQPILLDRIDMSAISKISREDFARQISDIIIEVLNEQRFQLNRAEQQALIARLLDDMLGLGPLEPLLADDTVTDILVNGHAKVYVERAGKLELSGIRFRDDAHVINVATRIVSRIGRRVDESSPMVDARLMDGSRVNITIPPLSIDGPTISIRKFSKKTITLDVMTRQQNISAEMSQVLRIASRCKLNILISGGTGSGKTTLLNAMSQMIDTDERIVTIEDAAELQLQQPHVVRLETRPPNLEDRGEITMRDLLRNALRMRPDRIILGEVRGAETLDMLQAMNTGHDGSMCTIHANNPREALVRLENMVAMAGSGLPAKAVRAQAASGIQLIIQVARMRDGIRRVTHVVEVIGMEEDVVLSQELFHFEPTGERGGRLTGDFVSTRLRPAFLRRAEYFRLDQPLLEAMSCRTRAT
jgi:pilus assembly protein CpaF